MSENTWHEWDHKSFRAAMMAIAIAIVGITFCVCAYKTAKVLHGSGQPCKAVSVHVEQTP